MCGHISVREEGICENHQATSGEFRKGSLGVLGDAAGVRPVTRTLLKSAQECLGCHFWLGSQQC